jgi:hypothetical protein
MKNTTTTSRFPLPKDKGWTRLPERVEKLEDAVKTIPEAPKYKVYTALLTQSDGDNPVNLTSGAVTKGVTYVIDGGSDGDFSNVGAPNNDDSTWFVAINDEVPNSYGTTILIYNTGAPVVIVLENTIGNIWFTYIAPGEYQINSSGLFTIGKLWGICPAKNGQGDTNIFAVNDVDSMTLATSNSSDTLEDSLLADTSIEIRVYN